MSSSRGSPWPKGQTRISCSSWVAGGLFTAEPPRKLIVLISGSQSVIWGVLVFSRSAEMDYHKLQFSHSVLSDSATPWTAAHQASLSITNAWRLLKLMSIELVMPFNHLILYHPFCHLQSFPASGSILMSQFFTSGGQSIGVSASTSVLPMSIQGWFLLGWIGWISLQSKGLSRVIFNTTVQKHQFFGTQLSL